MIYDQAMFVNLPTRGIQILANFRYSVDERVPEEEYLNLEVGTYEAFISRCSETMVGIVIHNESGREINCSVGYQQLPLLNHATVHETDEYAPDIQLAQVSAVSEVEIVVDADEEELSQTKKSSSGNHLVIDAQEREVIADLINASNMPYTASSYTQGDEDETGLALAQIKKSKSHKKFGEDT